MHRPILLFILAVIGAGVAAIFLAESNQTAPISDSPTTTATSTLPVPPPDQAVGCTEEAKICPDGSTVVRGGPQCEFADCPALATTTETITLALGERQTVLGLTLIPTRVVSDSRCAPDVVCIWAGTVEIAIDAETMVAHGSQTLTLGTPAMIGDYRVTLRAVTPEHAAAVTPDQPYSFTVEVTRP